MWLLRFLPDSFLYFVVLCTFFSGIAAYTASRFISYLPMLLPYQQILRVGGVILMIIGIYFYGSYSTEMWWREKVKELEAKIAIAEEQSKTANAKIETKVVQKTKIIKDLQIVYRDKIVEVAAKIDSQCVIEPESLSILNDAAKTPGVSK